MHKVLTTFVFNFYYKLSVTSHINCIVARWPDKGCLSHNVPLSGHHDVTLLNGVINDAESQNQELRHKHSL